MIGFENENIEQNINKKRNRICIISNIILSVFYGLFSCFFSFLGIMFFSLGLSDKIFTAVCSFIAALLLLLTPIFSIFSIIFSVVFRKKGNYGISFLVQFFPFGTLGMALIAFFLSVIIV